MNILPIDGFLILSSIGVVLVFILLKLIIPPLIGFTAKFTVFAAAVSGERIWLPIVGLSNMILSAYCYFKIAHQMFFMSPEDERTIKLSPGALGSSAVAFAAMVFTGILPETVYSFLYKIVP